MHPIFRNTSTRRLRPYWLALAVSLLAGCNLDGAFTDSDSGSSSSSSSSSGGSSGGGSGAEQEGIFNAGTIEGLRYTAPSFSGLLDNSGTFRYRDGEDVEFSLGGVILGSAAGAEALNLFDLVGSEPLADEAQLRAALQDRERVGALDRVANMATLLVTLDRDVNPDNGLDLTGWDTDLADYQIDFEHNLFLFPERRATDALRAIRTEFDIDYEVASAVPLLFVYDALGIVVPAHQPVLETIDSGNNGSIEEEIETRYNDLDLPEIIRRYESPNSADDWNQWVRLRYDELGREVSLEIERETNGDDRLDDIYRRSRFFDEAGLLQRAEIENGTQAVDELVEIDYQYDKGGNQTRYRLERDDGLNGILDEIEQVDSRYDDDGLLRDSEQEIDTDGDGRVEQRRRFELRYSSDGLLTRVIDTLDGTRTAADGVVDTRTETRYEYDNKQRLAREVQSSDDNADGVVDSELIIRRTYNNRDLLVKETWERDKFADGSVESRQEFDFRYDDEDLLERLEIQYDDNGDENADSTDISEYSYNERGQLLRLESVLRNASGAVQRSFLERRTYGDFAEPLTRLTDTDGSSEVSNTPVMQRWVYREIDDGLRFLIDFYRTESVAVVDAGVPCATLQYIGDTLVCIPAVAAQN
ncbi:hypothetical protein [Microbulbifer aggregans]|uniref:hypothetical protein n=1 Tax=Microbulbifer aggregans TaxID=1769779 RepID=UPI001CFCD292|nr:hypothetical protein [Microbulbifer aggregans]